MLDHGWHVYYNSIGARASHEKAREGHVTNGFSVVSDEATQSAMTSQSRFDRIRPVLCCPACGGDLSFSEQAAACQPCAASYPIRGGRIFFIEPMSSEDDLDSLKTRLRTIIGSQYRNLVDIISPDFPVLHRREMRRRFDPATELILDVGSGSQRLDEDVICVDGADYQTVDVICDIHHLPFRANAVDGVMCWGVLEHVEDPYRVSDNLLRCTRAGGHGLHSVPFLYPFHASPHDYRRFTHKGMALLFRGWKVTEVRNASGPVSFLLLGLAEVISIFLSLGRESLRPAAYLLACLLLFPFKVLDIPFINRKSFIGMAPMLMVATRKPEKVKVDD